MTEAAASSSAARGLVLVGFAEALSAPEVVWSLVDAGFEVAAFARRGRPVALARSRHVTVTEIDAPEDDVPAALAQLERLLESLAATPHASHVLLPLDDTAVWLCSHAARGEAWTLAGADGPALELALDKERQVAVARAVGLRVPRSVFARTAGELAGHGIGFPLILRSSYAVRREGSKLRKGANWICADEAEMARAVTAWAGKDPLIVQPFVEGVGEGVFGLVTEDGVTAWSAHRRVRMMNPHGSGSSACAWRGVDESLKGPIAAFLATVGWRGMFMIELLRTPDGQVWFIEFNGRAWGSMALARRQSLEYPAWTVRQALARGFTVDVPPAPRDGLVCRHVGRELMHLLFVLRGSRSKAIRHWPGVGETLRALLRFRRSDGIYNWRADDWRVFVADVWHTLVRNVAKTRRARPAREVLLLGGSPAVRLEACRSLGRAGYRVTLLRLRPQPAEAEASRHCAAALELGSPEDGARAFAQRLSAFLRSSRFDHVVPLDAMAMELLSLAGEAALAHLAGPDAAALAKAGNRWSALAVAGAAGLRTPDTVLLKRGSAEGAAAAPLPCLVRPSRDCAIVEDTLVTLSSRTVSTPRALDAKLRDDLPRADVLLQSPAEGERLDVALCAVGGRLVAHAVTSGGRVERPDAVILAVAERIVSQLPWTGFLVVQCCKTSGDDVPTFVDLQFGASRELAALRRSGVDLPAALLRAIDGVAGQGAPARRIDLLDDPAPAFRALWSRAAAFSAKVGLRLRSSVVHRLGAAPGDRLLDRSQAILLVCQGNINRSLVAEQILRKRGFARVASAGLLGMAGRRPSMQAETFVAERLGMDATGLRSLGVAGALARLGGADLAVCFERRQAVELIQRHPELRGKVVLLTSLAAQDRPVDVPDPHNQPDAAYARCFERIERLLDQAIDRSAARARRDAGPAPGISLPRG